MSVGGGQVERGIVAHVGRVNPRPTGDEHLDDLSVAALGRPVQRRELMVIPAKKNYDQFSFAITEIPALCTHPWFMSCSVSSSHMRTCMESPFLIHWKMSSIFGLLVWQTLTFNSKTSWAELLCLVT